MCCLNQRAVSKARYELSVSHPVNEALRSKHLYICITIIRTYTTAQRLKRHEVLIIARSFVIVTPRGWGREVSWYKTIIKSLQLWWIIDLMWIWAPVLCFVQLINAASAAPRSKNPLFWMSKGCCNRECLNLKDTSVFHFCLLVLLQRIYYIFNQSPQSLNSPSLVSTINISIIVEKLLLHGYSYFFLKEK